MELVLAGESRLDTTDLDGRKPMSRRRVGGPEKLHSETVAEFGISRCKLLRTEWINNKVLLYRAGECIQYPVINRNGKEYVKECIYIWVTESLCHTAEINTTL